MGINIPDRIALLACKAKTDTIDGTATILLKVPGTPGTGPGRAIVSGEAYFETQDFDDIAKIYITDEDNILGYGAGTIIDSFIDTEVPAENQGWFINKHTKVGVMQSVGDSELLPSGLYLKVIAITGDARADTLRLNISWGLRK